MARTGLRGHNPALEWIAAGAGFLVLAFFLVLLGREAMDSRREAAPAIALRVVAIEPAAAGFILTVEAHNASQATAAAVAIEARSGDESAELMFDYVPGRGKRRGGLMFAADPRAAGVELKVLGFQSP